MCKSIKAVHIYTFSHKIKLIYLTANKSEKWTNIPGSKGHEKNMVLNSEVQNGSCVNCSILGDSDWLSALFYLDI